MCWEEVKGQESGLGVGEWWGEGWRLGEGGKK